MHNWYIRQDIVCIKSHVTNLVIKDETYVIQGIRIAPCKCKYVLLDVGIKNTFGYIKTGCRHCGHLVPMADNDVCYFSEEAFAPLDALVQINEITEILSIPKLIEV
jgi:hypothetical protein